MAKIVYLILGHDQPEILAKKVQLLTAFDDCAVIHFDKNAPKKDFERLISLIPPSDKVAYIARRKCGWGDWSLVGATLAMLRFAEERFEDATHFYLISRNCIPVHPRDTIAKTLDDASLDYIECHDLTRSDWIKTGLREDRLAYRHFFNERTQSRFFYASYYVQKFLGLKRKPPKGVDPKVGSQWWCLRRKTVENILSFCAKRPDILRFFRRSWIPDESFFQTIVSHTTPREEITNRAPTLILFSDYGMPVTFHQDHMEILRTQSCFFVRKMSDFSHAHLIESDQVYAGDAVEEERTTDIGEIYQAIVQTGRDGYRARKPIWETSSDPSFDDHLTIFICKRWDIADHFRHAIWEHLGIHGVGYLFNTEPDDLQDLGGFETSALKRSRNRSAIVKLLMSQRETKHLLVCVDPGSLDVIKDLRAKFAYSSVLYRQVELDDAFFEGHIERMGRLTPGAALRAKETLVKAERRRFERVLSELRRDIRDLYEYGDNARAEDNLANVAAALWVGSKEVTKMNQQAAIFKEETWQI